MNIVICELIEKFEAKGMLLKSSGDKLQCLRPAGINLTDEEKILLKNHKQKIIDYLNKKSTFETVENIFHLTPLQEGMLFHDMYESNSDQYRILITWKYHGKLNAQNLKEAWQAVIQNHQILRTRFVWEKVERPLQVIHQNAKMPWEETDWRSFDKESQQAKLEILIHQNRQKSIELSKTCAMHLTLVRLEDDLYQCIWTCHHILIDGWSIPLLFQELHLYYEKKLNGNSFNLLSNPSYSSYLKWLSDKPKTRAIGFWHNHLLGFNETTALGVNNNSLDVRKGITNLEHLYFNLSSQDQNNLKSVAQDHQITQNAIYQFAWSLALSVLSRSDDVLHGTVVAGRPVEFSGADKVVGLFINTIPVRFQFDPEKNLSQLMKEMHNYIQETNEHSYVSLNEIHAQTALPNDIPLFNNIFVFENYPKPQEGAVTNTGHLELSDFHSHEKTNYPLSVIVALEDGAKIDFAYDADCFSKSAIEAIENLYKNVLTQILKDPHRSLKDLNLSTPEEKSFLFSCNETAREYPSDKTVVELFELQAKNTPRKVAAVFEDREITYAELNKQANQLARFLRKEYERKNGKKLQAGSLVGLCINRNFGMMVGLLGILKAGAAYVPLDPSYPKDRLNLMLKDGELELVVTQTELLKQHSFLSSAKRTVCCLDELEEKLSNESSRNPKNVNTPEDLAYIIYTSGSTGMPKGTCINHRAIVNLTQGSNFLDVKSDDCVGQLANYAFDAVTFEIWGALLNGARVAIVDKDSLFSLEEFAAALKKNEINTIFLTTALFNSLAHSSPETLYALKTVLFGGEAVNVELVQKFLINKPESMRLVHVYGPTECTTFSHYFDLTSKHKTSSVMPIGKPVSNKIHYVLDHRLNLVPKGIPGELYIGGDGLAREYLKRSALTAERFIENPFLSKEERTKKKAKGEDIRLYKTGDLVRWLSDGNLEFLGRMDSQIKLRGFRIELGEIENVLNQCGWIKESTVVVTEEEGQRYLTGYYIPEKQTTSPEEKLKLYLQEKLPDYMVPSVFVALEKFPLNTSGKVDKQALPKFQRESSSDLNNNFEVPRTKEEKLLLEIWQKVFKKDNISVKENFFTLGGDSIISIQVISRARDAGLQITAKDIFSCPTIEQLAKIAKQATDLPKTEQGPLHGEVPLTPIQSWFFEQKHPEIHYFNQASTFTVKNPLDIKILQKSLDVIAKHHDALRLRYRRQENMWTQHYLEEPSSYKPEVEEITCDSGTEEEFLTQFEKHCNNLQSHLNIETGPIMRAALFLGHPDGQQRLFITIHHLIVDGVSWRILCEDLQTVYRQIQHGKEILLPPKTSSYHAWAKAMKSYALNNNRAKEWEYWINTVSNVPSFPVDGHKGLIDACEFDLVIIELEKKQTEKLLTKVSSAYNTQINDILLSALSSALCQWRQIDDILIHLEGHGREECISDVDVSRTLGWFTSIFPVRLKTSSQKTGKLIKTIKETLRKIPNKGIGYGILRYMTEDRRIQKLIEGDNSSISFNYLGQLENIAESDALLPAQGILESVGLSSSLRNKSAHAININGFIYDGRLKLYLAYSKKHFQKLEMSSLAKHYKNSLSGIIEHCSDLKNTHYTPSDFPLADLDQQFLDSVDNEIIEDVYALAPLQKGMLFHALYTPNSDLYHTQLNWMFKNLNIDVFRKSWHQIIKKYPILRTGFISQDYRDPIQIVYKNTEIEWKEQDWRNISEQTQKEKLDFYLERQRGKAFEFDCGRLMRFDLIRLNEEKTLFSWTHHHILIDGWSLSVIMNELVQTYLGLERQELSILPELGYKNYIYWLGKQDQDKAKSFWQAQLQGFYEPTLLNINKSAIDIRKPITRLETLDYHFPEDLTQQIENFAKKCQVTSNVIFQLAWSKLLSFYSGQNDVLFGVTVSGRPGELANVEKIAGLFINTLPLRVSCQEKKVTELLAYLQKTMQEVNHYGYLNLMDIQKVSQIHGNQSLFHSLFVFENYPTDQVMQKGSKAIVAEPYKSHEKTNYPLSIIIIPGERFLLRIAYDAENFTNQSINLLTKHIQQIIENVLHSPGIKISDIDLLTPDEMKPLLDFKLEKQPNRYENLISWFESKVQHHEESEALIFAGESLTYKELNERSNQVANHLRIQYKLKHGRELPLGSFIGLCVERNLNIAIGILGILKAGGAYIPLDPANPEERLNFILKDAYVPMLLTQESVLERLPGLDAPERILAFMDRDNEVIATLSQKNLEIKIPSDSSCYAIYTSGTTGKPKGVLVSHENVTRLFEVTEKDYAFSEDDIWTLFHSYAFDFSVWELWGALLYGGRAVIVPKEVARDPEKYWNLLKKENVTVLNQTPSAFKQLTLVDAEHGQKLESLKYVVFGGESLTKDHIKLWTKKNGFEAPKLINMYGITEITVHGTFYEIREEDLLADKDNISIGQRLKDLSFYVLDKERRLVPQGIPGEVYVGGAGVVSGYLHRPKLTHERFIENPFLTEKERIKKKKQGENTRLYRTGDLAKWLENGNLEYAGRCDDQVKIRGFRVELGEIESKIKEHLNIDNVVVLVKKDTTNNDYLCAYLETTDFLDTALSNLREYIKALLPAYMIPSDFIAVQKFPLNHSGKIDKKTLLTLSNSSQTPKHDKGSSLNEIEKNILEVFEKLLEKRGLSVSKNFFDMGVHSLMVVQATQILNKELRLKLEPVDLFTYTSVHKLADYILSKDKKNELANSHFKEKLDDKSDRAIAVIGMSCRFPEADSVQDFWKVLMSGKETIKHLSDEELSNTGISQELISNPNYVKARGILENIDEFDASFFNYSPSEAAILDPQHRLFLEQAWSALEDAGCVPSSYSGKIGVYAGASDSSYLFSNIFQGDAAVNYDPYQILIGTSSGTLTTKTSYKLNLTGPSLNINTACSTSLVGIATACEQLRSGACDVALAGGASIGIPQKTGYMYQEGGIPSPDGHCRAFDAKAQGTVPSSGVGVVVLKRLGDALKDNDHIEGVIIGSAVNNDGTEKVGYTAPSVIGQSTCIQNALEDARIDPATVKYIETHGTGTPLGDPIEIKALKKAYGEKNTKKSSCAIGAVKTNMGHADSAAGVAGFIKTSLLLKKKKLVPSLHFNSPSPNIDFKNSPLYVNTTLKDWKSTETHPRRAGVSSFGIGGTNAHIILEEAPFTSTDEPLHKPKLLTLSAKTDKALQAYAKNLAKFLGSKKFSSKEFADIAYTLKTGREEFSYRKAIIASNQNEAINQLERISSQKTSKSIEDTQKPSLAFVFSGQGSQYVNMGVELYKKEKVFKDAVDECSEILKSEMSFDLKEILYPLEGQIKEAATKISETQYTQPALFVVEYALSKLLFSWGIEPDNMIGHSLGEYVAAHFAGVFSLPDVLMLVAKRADLMSQAEKGDMLAVPLSEEKIKPFLSNDLSLAVINAPELIVISGKKEAVSKVEQELLEKYPEIQTRKLHTSHAFHSCMMDPVLDSFRKVLSSISTQRVQRPFVSNFTGKQFAEGACIDKEYWVNHLRYTVRFSEGLKTLCDNHSDLFLRIGPGSSLASLLQPHKKGVIALNTLPHAKEFQNQNINSAKSLLDALGRLWTVGIKIDWPLFYKNERRQKITLPTYPFERKKYWINPGVKQMSSSTTDPSAKIDEWFYAPSWERGSSLKNLISQDYNGSWIVFTNESSFSKLLLNELKMKTKKIITVTASSEFKKKSEFDYEINPLHKGNYEKLFKGLGQEPKLHLLYLWSMSEFKSNSQAFGTPEIDVNSDFNTLLLLSQACCSEISSKTHMTFLVFANNAFKVFEGDFVDPRKSLLLGICRTLPLEQQNIKMNFFDIDQSSSNYPLSFTAHSNTNKSQIFASRAGYLWKEKLIQKTIEKRSNAKSILKKRGTYLITGGLGGIGLSIAEYLGSKFQAKLILVTRSMFPEKSNWNDYLNNHLTDDSTSKKIIKLQKILKNGANIDIHQADISAAREAQALINDCISKHGHINGIIHAAGAPGGGFIAIKNIKDAENVLVPKVQGTSNLIQAVRKHPLDLFFMCSALTSYVGVPGQSDYASANAFLDAIPQTNMLHHNTSVMTINWNAWREVGMAAEADIDPKGSALGNNISPWEGLDVFDRMLKQKEPHLLVSLFPPKIYQTKLLDAFLREEKSNLEHENYAFEDPTENQLASLFYKLLGTDEIELDSDFFELGGHSLLALRLIAEIERTFQREITIADIYRLKTIESLATFINKPKEGLKKASIMVPIQKEGKKCPVFFIHPIGGTVFSYIELAKYIDNDRPIYAIQDPGLESNQFFFETFKDLATCYLKEIKKIQLHGPYLLGGWSYGGGVAFEIAKQLEGEGEKVDFLGMIDTWCKFSSVLKDKNYFRKALNAQKDQMYSQGIKNDFLNEDKWFELQWQRMELFFNYKPEKINTKIALFKAEDLMAEYKPVEDPYNHWENYSSSPVDVFKIPGDHQTTMRYPNITKLGKLINKIIK